ncbi:hypothetical protein OFC51_35485, partial [Escherichia coli]|nr:hypothetical protein [Escherichia coli]
MLATGDEIKPAKLWDVMTGQLRHTLSKHKASIRAVFSPDGRTLATSGDRKVALWNTETGELKYMLTGSTEWPFGFT